MEHYRKSVGLKFMQKFYINEKGEYVGSGDGSLPPGAFQEVPHAPKNAAAIWKSTAWAEPEISADESVQAEIIKQGYSTDLAVQALIRDKMGDSSMLDNLIKKIKEAEIKFPQPISAEAAQI